MCNELRERRGGERPYELVELQVFDLEPAALLLYALRQDGRLAVGFDERLDVTDLEPVTLLHEKPDAGTAVLVAPARDVPSDAGLHAADGLDGVPAEVAVAAVLEVGGDVRGRQPVPLFLL